MNEVQDCIRCGQPLTDESLHIISHAPILDEPGEFMYTYRHSPNRRRNGCQQFFLSKRLIKQEEKP